MNAEEFKSLLTNSIGWAHEISIDECNDNDCSFTVSLVLWGETITDCFAVGAGRWYSEAGDGIIVDTPLTVWQWIAIRFCDMVKEVKQ